MSNKSIDLDLDLILTYQIIGLTKEVVPTITQIENNKKLTLHKTQEEINNILELCSDNDIKTVNYKSVKYPTKLKNYLDAPALLFYQGDIELLNKETIAIIGSRELDDYSTKLMELTKLQEKIIISGMAYGTDIFAHNLSLEQDKPCVAVLPNGILDQVFYPKVHIGIKNQILAKNGLIISQFLPDFQSKKYSFLIRNNLITQLADVVWVVKAASKSGSFCTGKLGLKNKKTVYSTIKDIFDQNYKGNLELIELGATPLVNLNSIALINKNIIKTTLTKDEEKIINLIISGINQFDMLLEKIEYITLVESLMKMESKNIIFNNQGEYQVIGNKK